MNKANLPPIAIIADAHVHDIESHYDFSGKQVAGNALTLRSWADTRRSSRVFNESRAAFLHALHDIENKGIKHVVLLGDYTDDGQIEATTRMVDLLKNHADQYGTHFYVITGNHDAFGPLGKHQSTRFVDDQNHTVLVTSDPKVAATEPESAVLTPKMYCEGVADGVLKMSAFGLFNQPDFVHWESPFGLSDSLENRRYKACSEDGLQRHSLVDASYLVEPVEGLWLLMIDANVFEPRNGQRAPHQKKAFLDSSDAGWNSVLKNRPHLIDWISDVCTRAEQTGKTMIACSHYPIIDAFCDSRNSAATLFGNHEMLRRKPAKEVADVLLNAGVKLHFSGHLHINAQSLRTNGKDSITDCAVPSLAAFPACYKVVHTCTDALSIDTIQLSSMAVNPLLIAHYRDEIINEGDADHAALNASSYGEFLYQRMHCRVIHHYLEKDWPNDIAASVLDTNTADLALLMLTSTTSTRENTLAPQSLRNAPSQLETLESEMSQHGLTLDELGACSMTQLISDWYCLRHAGLIAIEFISPANLRIYTWLTDRFANSAPEEAATHRAFFAILLDMFKSSMHRTHKPLANEE